MGLQPGVYRSDVDGHLLVLKDPLQVTCIVCSESCCRADYQLRSAFEKAARAFVEKHGALADRIGDTILDLLPQT